MTHTLPVAVLKGDPQGVTTLGILTGKGQNAAGDTEFEDGELAALDGGDSGTLGDVGVGRLVAPLTVRVNPHRLNDTHPPLQQPAGQVQVAQRSSDVECHPELEPGIIQNQCIYNTFQVFFVKFTRYSGL